MSASGVRTVSLESQPVTQLEAHPAQRRQVDGPVALFWDQPTRGLVCTFVFCRMPSCRCHSLLVRIQDVDDQIQGVRNDGGDRTCIVAGPGTSASPSWPWADVTLDLDSGSFTVDAAGIGASEQPASASEIPDRFRQFVDTTLLEHLRPQARARRGQTEEWRGLDWSWFEPGDTVAWPETFPDAADGVFEVEGHSFITLDRYCVDPACECDETLVEFVEVRRESLELMGVVVVSMTTGTATKFHPAPGAKKLLKAAWTEYADGQLTDLAKLLPDRQKRMKEVGQELLSRRVKPVAALAARKPGPNEPCSCGSGRKFKRCCMGKA